MSDAQAEAKAAEITAHLENLAERIRTMPPADKLRLAANLIEEKEFKHFRIIRQLIDGVSGDIAIIQLAQRDRR